MVRKSLVALTAALSLVTATAQAAPVRLASPIAESESLTEDDDWIIPVVTIIAVILIILLDNDDDEDLDAPVSP